MSKDEKEKQKYVRISITLPEDLSERLSKYSDEEGVPKSRAIQKLLEKLLTEKGY